VFIGFQPWRTQARITPVQIAVPLRRHAFRYALAFVAGVSSIGLVGAAVRVLPWALDSTVPWAIVVPFARSVAMVALEAAILLGWPLGWGLAAQRFVELGEARVFALLGESPVKTALRALPSGLVFAAALGLASVLGARDASAPGRVLSELVAEGRATCERVQSPRSLTVPFLGANWVCVPGRAPRLVAPAPMGGLVVTAAGAKIAGDFRRIDLEDAYFSPNSQAEVRVGSLTLRGLPPWSQSSILPPALRALVVVVAAFASAWLTMVFLLARRIRGRAMALVVAASGPLAALGALRFIERRAEVTLAPFFLVPLGSALAIVASAWLGKRLHSLLAKTMTASK
jgi:hypothetical protein